MSGKTTCKPLFLPQSTVFFDSHCHFDFVEFDEDRDAVWGACQSLGVKGAIIPGTSPRQWPKAATISANHENIFYAAGLHPWFIKDVFISGDIYSEACEEFRQQLIATTKHPKCVAIGECGLDGSIEMPLSTQQIVFDVQLRIANELSLPVIIHCHKAHNEMLASLRAHKIKGGGVIHAFSGSIELAKQYCALGFALGVGGTITYERANKTRESVKQIPLEHILLETDSPDMPLSGKQGQRNSPENIPIVAQTLAGLRGDTLENIAQQTTANVQKLFFRDSI